MCAEPDGDFFLCAAVEWATIARTATVPDPVIATLYRELAFCHLLFKRGRYAAVLTRLRIACGLRRCNVTIRPPDRAETLAVAANLLASLRLRFAVAESPAAVCYT
jgi:hypothetical protein